MSLQDAELNYFSIFEHYCLTLILATQKLRHYLLALGSTWSQSPTRWSTSSNDRPCQDALPDGSSNRMNLISPLSPKELCCQALLDFLAQFPSKGYKPLYGDSVRKEICSIENKNGALPSTNLSPTGKVAQELCCMLLMPLTSPLPWN